MTATDVLPRPRNRSRLFLVAIALGMLASNVYFLFATHNATQAMEARAIAGNFPAMHLEAGPATIEEDGRVYGREAGPDPTGYVASTKLIPAGTYQTLIIADDADAAKKAKAALVIGARDKAGAWYPATAAAIATRLTKHQGDDHAR